MAEALRRAKLRDTVLVAVLLVLFTVVPFVLLFTDESREFDDSALQQGYVITIAASWPLLLLGSIPLACYWRKDRSLDEKDFSSATRPQLNLIIMGTASITSGCALLIAGQVIWIVEVFRQEKVWASIVFGVISVLLLAWITHCVIMVAFEARKVKKSLQGGGAEEDVEVLADSQPDGGTAASPA